MQKALGRTAVRRLCVTCTAGAQDTIALVLLCQINKRQQEQYFVGGLISISLMYTQYRLL